MTFIKVDVIKLGSFINNLRYWIIDADSSRHIVRAKVNFEDPAQIWDVVSDNSTMARVTSQLSSLRESLETRKVSVEVVNRQSGRLNTDVECGYYLPDGLEDTSANVREHNITAIQEAKADAKADYDRHNGKNSARPTYVSREKYQDNPVYALAYIHELGEQPGVDKNDSGIHVYLDMISPVDSNDGSPWLNSMIHILAAASQDEVNGGKLAQEIYANDGKQVDSWWHQDRRWALTYVLSYENKQPVPFEMPKFGTDFLTSLASKAENDPDASSRNGNRNFAEKEYTADILAGAMNAMARNPEAALEYLANDVTVDSEGKVTPSQATLERWLKLEKRTWDGEFYYGFGTNAFTAALAAASGYRNLTDDQAGLKNADARATWLSGEVIKLFSSDEYGANTYFHDIPEKSKRNLGVVLANSPEEVASMAGGTQMTSDDISGPRMSCSEKQAASLLYRIIDNEDAAATIAAKLADYHQKRIDEQLSKDPQFSTLSDEYNKAASSEGFLEQIAETRYEHNKKNKASKESTFNTASTIFGAVLMGVVTVGTAGMAAPAAALIGASAGVSTAFAQPLVAESVVRDIRTKANAPSKDVSVRNRLEAQAYSDAAEHNLFSEEVNKSAVDEGIVLKDDQKIDPEHNSSVTNWRHRSAKIDGRVDDLAEKGVGNGLDRGREQVDPLLVGDNDYQAAKSK